MKPFDGLIIAVDFDGTCVTHEYPQVGDDIGAADVLRDLVEKGARLILWTMRSGNQLDDAAGWFVKNSIPLFGVNDNPEQKSWTDSRKVYAHVYIDDAALGAPLLTCAGAKRPYLDWVTTRRWLWSRFVPDAKPSSEALDTFLGR